ncbi:MAG TPA: preprotein translocase subunit SecA [Thermotogota bacterium]|nr:preprotein translocase subunit SecA [Thermotogota bacterium]HPJ87711.1 preprotein translocase subunit SecA [Thermotogota bacterium]HPR94850.1 preprotein translocase subunit SecA [Thermotogota bacterium]
MGFFSKMFDKNEKEIKKYREIVKKINALEADYSNKTNAELKTDIDRLRSEMKKEAENSKGPFPGHNQNREISFAITREIAKRTLGQRPFDVQMIGAITLDNAEVAEMKTGEGKTLVATLPVTFNAFYGKGVHMVTVNDYLARRDAQWMAPIYLSQGLSVGVINNQGITYRVEWDDEEKAITNFNSDVRVWPKDFNGELPNASDYNGEAVVGYKTKLTQIERRDVYQLDIVYGTNNEFGFDYLRDNMVYETAAKSQPSHFFAIIDEVDSILIDEARTPLIISGPSHGTQITYSKFARMALKFTGDKDYEIDEKSRTCNLTDEGIARAEKLLGIDNLYDPVNIDNLYHINNALIALHMYKNEVDYIVQDGEEIVIVDSFTGRLMPGRRFSGGLHQALEAKEGVKVREESVTYATITFQNFFRMYDKLAGMTGTAKTEEEEFDQIYNMNVLVIPTNMPIARKDHDDEIYRTETEKYAAIIKEIKASHEKGQPVLVGTTSIEKSELISKSLTRLGLKHEVLNAKYHEREAEIVARAGEEGAITIATNMAGRGTDIKLSDEVKEKGGLYVIGTERHEARRIDNQLRGRSGRQGDNGASKFYLSVEDDLVRVFGGERIGGIMDALKLEQGEPIHHSMLTNLIERAQKKVEGMHFAMRKYLLQLDTIMDAQRKAIYEHRDWILGEEDISSHLKEIYEEVISRRVKEHANGSDWDIDGLKKSLALFPIDTDFIRIEKYNTADELEQDCFERIYRLYNEKKDEVGQDFSGLQKFLLLRIVDERWRKHLENIERVKEGINLRSYGQKDPQMEFKREANRLFDEMIDLIYDDMASMLLRVARTNSEQASEKAQKEIDSLQYTHDEMDTFNRQKRRKVTQDAQTANKKKRFKVKR